MRRSFAGGLAAVLIAAPLYSSRHGGTDPAWRAKLDKEQQILHALDRFTFGPRPGDIEHVKRLGLKRWIDLQLNPERITENPALAARLAPLESLQMTPAEAVRNYPPPQLIRAVALGRRPPPQDPELRAVVERLAARYRARQAAKAQSDSDPNAPKNPNAPVGDEEIQPARALEEILNAGQIRTLRTGTPQEKHALLRSLPYSSVDDLVVALPRPLRQQLIAVGPVEVRRKLLLENAPQQVVAYDLSESKLDRAIYSNRQLQEVLTDFWFNHFNVFLDKGADRYLVPSYERDVIRPRVLGHFRDLLGATAASPAMLFYLDNWQSVAPDSNRAGMARRPQANPKRRGLNENYARELMELHTLGVDGGYTQKDIIEVARCFTGWTIREPRLGGGFYFNGKVHDQGEKVVLGVRIPAGGGIEDGEKVLDILARHPSTARFISTQLAQRFVADNPPDGLINAMAKRFRDTDGNIREVLRTMATSKEFWSQGAYRAKVKTPFETIVSAVRASDASVQSAFALVNLAAQLGQPLYRKLEPTGYSSANAEWVNSAALLARMNFALALAQNKVPGVNMNLPGGSDPLEIARSLLFTDPGPQTREAIQKGASPAMIAGLVLGSPEFQRR